MSFSPVLADGGGLAQCVDISPGGVMFAGSDTQGAYRSASSPYGNDWLVRNAGIGASQFFRQMATIMWSKRETGVVYAGTGDTGSGGGLLVWSETTKKWSQRASAPQWAGNHPGAGDPVPQVNWARPAGRLLVQDTGSDYLFAGTYRDGVLVSANNGNDNFPVTCKMGGTVPARGAYYCYGLAQVPGTPTTIYGLFYDAAGSSAVWKCTSAHAAVPNFFKLANSPATPADIVVLANGNIYVAAGNNGLYASSTAADTTWTAINGGTPTTAGGGLDVSAGNSWWNTLDAYTDGSGSDQVLVACGNPIKPSGAAGCACIVKVSVTNPGGSVTFTNLTTTGNVSASTIPPSGRPWWHAGSAIVLGGAGFVNPQIRWDPNDATHQRIYCTASQGLYRSVNGGSTWAIASGGMPQFLAHSVAVAPDKTVGFTDSDWCCFEVTDGDGHTGGVINNSPFHGEGWGICYGPDSTAWLSTGAKYSNSQGEVWTHPPGQPSGTWATTGFGTAARGKVAIGLAAFTDAAGNQALLAAAWGGGMYRYARGPSGAYAWARVSGAIGTTLNNNGGTTGNQLPIVYAGAGLVFCYDRLKGVFRSADYGKTWTLIWAKTTSDSLAGTLAVHPKVKGELWVSAAAGLYKLAGAATGTVAGGGITPRLNTALPGKNGPVAFDPAGNLICALRDTGNGSALVSSPDHGVTWADIAGDSSFAQNNCNPEFIAVGPDSRIYVSGSNVVTQGFAASGGGQGASAAFTERQASGTVTGTGGVLGLWFSEQAGGPAAGGTGLPSLPGSLLVARIETTDGTAVITPPAGWALAFDVAAAGTTATARVAQYHYLNNPGGVGGPASAAGPLTAGPAYRAPAALVAAPSAAGGAQALTPGAPVPGPVIAGGPLEAPGGGLAVFTSSNPAATIEGVLTEYTCPAGSRQFSDQAGTASGTAPATSLPVTAAAANTYTGGLATAMFGASYSATGSTWGAAPTGWTPDGIAANTTLQFAQYYQTGTGAGPATVTATLTTSANMTAWAAGVTTYYALAAGPVTVATTSCPNGTTGAAYSAQLAASGGVAPYTWALASGTPPPGLSLTGGGLLAGTPTAAGTYVFAAQVTDTVAQVAQATFTVIVAPALAVTTGVLPAATTTGPYSAQLAATGGTPGYTWAVTAGALPPGLGLSAAGLLAGTPTAAGPGTTAPVTAAPGWWAGPGSLAAAGGVAGVPLVTGGQVAPGPVTRSAVLAGAPAAGAYTFTVQVTDSGGATATAVLSVTVTAGALAITTVTLPSGSQGIPYPAVTLAAAGGVPPYTWAVTAGALPPGLSLAGNFTPLDDEGGVILVTDETGGSLL